jgi:hypothetical protein
METLVLVPFEVDVVVEVEPLPPLVMVVEEVVVRVSSG